MRGPGSEGSREREGQGANRPGAKVPGSELARVLLADSLRGANWPGSEKGVNLHQDATWYGGRPQPRGLYVRWEPSPPKFTDHVYYSYCDFVRTLHKSVIIGLFKCKFKFYIPCILFLEKFNRTHTVCSN